MMISHVAIYTMDLERLKRFYVTYFSAVANMKYKNQTTGLETYFLSFDGNSTQVELMYRPNVTNREEQKAHLGLIHLAFQLGSRAKVDYLTQLLESDGYEIVSQPRTTGDGYYESCILDPDGNQVELVA